MTIGQRLHILHLTDGNRGGSQRHIADLCRSNGESFRHFILRIAPDSIGFCDVDGDRLLAIDPERLAGGWPALLRVLIDELAIGCIHAHALAPLLSATDNGATATPVPYCLTLHDLRCIDPDFFTDPRAEALPDAHWIARCAPVVGAAGAVIVPSAWLAGIVRTHYPDAALAVIENGIARPPVVDLPIELPWTDQQPKAVYAIAGALGPHKGSESLARVANAIANPGIAGVLIGYTDNQTEAGWLVPGKLYVHGRYQHDELPALLKAYKCRLAYFPNIVPESFSYVLSEVWQAGLPALVPDVGALGERVRNSGAGWLLDDPRDAASAAAMIEKLLGPDGGVELAAATRRLDPPGVAVPDIAVTRPQVEAVYRRLAPAGAGSAIAQNADAGWTRIGYQTRAARFPGIDDSFLDAQWPSLIREEQSLRTWNAKLVGDVGGLEAYALRIQGHFEECVTRARRLEADISQLKARNDRIEADAAALRTRSAGLEAQVSDTTSRNRDLERDMVAIQSRNAELERHVIALRERNTRIEGDVSALIARNAQLEGDVFALTQRNIELDSSVVALKERNTLVEAGIAAIKQRNTRVEADAAALSSELGSTRDRLVAIDAELAARRARASQLERALAVLPSSVQTWLLRHAR